MSPLFVNAASQEHSAPGEPIDLHEVLRQRRQIAHIWSIEDVQQVRPDLDEAQAWQVLQAVNRSKDACLGIRWDSLTEAAETLFPLLS